MKSCYCRKVTGCILLGLMIIMLVGCATKGGKKKWYHWPWFSKKTSEVKTTSDELPPPPEAALQSKTGEVAPVPMPSDAKTDSSLPEPTPLRQPARPAEESELATVYFGFDRSDLTPEAKSILDVNARWLKEHPEITIQIEGHTDSRGTNEYNYSLGQRRATSVRDYLISTGGIEPDRLHTISYGEERPLDPNENEEAWSKNRRAQFLIY